MHGRVTIAVVTPPTETSAPRRGPGRPPKVEHRTAVLSATREIIAEVGYAGLTFEAVASRAGLYRRYLHRSFSSKAELVRDALFADVPAFGVPDTGSLEGDLEVYVRQYVQLNLRPEMMHGLPSLQVELIADSELMADTFERYVRPPVDALTTLLRRGVDRDELSVMPDPDLVLGCVAGSIQQIALRGLLDEDDLVDYLVRLLTEGVLA